MVLPRGRVATNRLGLTRRQTQNLQVHQWQLLLVQRAAQWRSPNLNTHQTFDHQLVQDSPLLFALAMADRTTKVPPAHDRDSHDKLHQVDQPL